MNAKELRKEIAKRMGVEQLRSGDAYTLEIMAESIGVRVPKNLGVTLVKLSELFVLCGLARACELLEANERREAAGADTSNPAGDGDVCAASAPLPDRGVYPGLNPRHRDES